MQKRPDPDAAIGRGLRFLAREQQDDGGFISYSSASKHPFRRVRNWQTIFVPALMLGSLAGLDAGEGQAVRDKLAGFLLEQRSSGWSFNYWAKASRERRAQPYPDDLDDTFCALSALYLHDPSLVDEAVVAKAVRMLLATENGVGGPYRTWLVPSGSEPVWLDVDPAVNANAAYFLSLIGSRVPRLDAYLDRVIASGGFSSPYYPSEYAFVYYFARAYEGPRKTKLLAMARRLHRRARTGLDRALCISARVRLGDTRDLSDTVRDLLADQRPDGAWPAATFYADPVKDGRPYYSGAAALSTAFALEALALYRGSFRGDDATAGGRPDGLSKAVLALAKERSKDMPKELRSGLIGLLGKLAGGSNGGEIVGLAERFNGSLTEPLEPAPKGFMRELGLANLCGWLAYTVYDDFLDGEGRPDLLPAANAAMRLSLEGFLGTATGDRAFGALVGRVFDAMDAANAWEQAGCRLGRTPSGRLKVGAMPDHGDLSKLAERSLGHCLAPMAVLAVKGIDVDSGPGRQILQALRHYLIVRQLCDDAHDWPEDLAKGHVTAVVSLIISDMKLGRGTYDAAGLTAEARPVFWRRTLPRVNRLARRHAALSRRAFKRSGLMRTDSGMDDLLRGLEASLDEALAMRERADRFLKHYEAKAPSR